jgi:hypothetical protein
VVLGGGDHEFTRWGLRREITWGLMSSCFNLRFLLYYYYSFLFWELEVGEGERNPGINS